MSLVAIGYIASECNTYLPYQPFFTNQKSRQI